jgi:2-oxoisovalerate dehydrogenase E1 component alpha subunit
MLQILTPSGALAGTAPLDLVMTRRLYRAMVFARVYDRKGTSLQKQGRLATYAPFEGQEAAQVGSAAALHPDDWMVATYRDAAAMWMQGYPLELLFAGRTGDERGGSPPDHVPVLPPSITVGGHMVHAVGLAWAAKNLKDGRVALTYFGDGATSEGDFHEAMNFAAVYVTPTVFLCQNNGFAISYPRSEQTRSESIAMKAEGYGMRGVQVDGNDVAAVLITVREALDTARTGGGPSLVEAVTYRLGPHTTADDPTRYRDEGDAGGWRELDPLIRVRLLLERASGWTPEWQAQLEESASQRIEAAVAWAEALPAPTLDEMFQRMYSEPTSPLRAQQEEAGR